MPNDGRRDFVESFFDLDRTYIGSVERGERNIAALNLVKIAGALGVKVGDLLDGEE